MYSLIVVKQRDGVNERRLGRFICCINNFRVVYFIVLYTHLELGISVYKVDLKNFVNPYKESKE